MSRTYALLRYYTSAAASNMFYKAHACMPAILLSSTSIKSATHRFADPLTGEDGAATLGLSDGRDRRGFQWIHLEGGHHVI